MMVVMSDKLKSSLTSEEDVGVASVCDTSVGGLTFPLSRRRGLLPISHPIEQAAV